MSTRLELENFIFYRAACLQTCVHGENNRLCCLSYDPYLQVAVYLYNACFGGGSGKVSKGRSFLPLPAERGGIKNGWILPPPLG